MEITRVPHINSEFVKEMCKSDTKHICFANPPHLGSMIQRIIEIRKISRRFSSVYLGTMYLLFS